MFVAFIPHPFGAIENLYLQNMRNRLTNPSVSLIIVRQKLCEIGGMGRRARLRGVWETV